MAIEVISDEDGIEYTERVPDYPEPASEPPCWAHHSNVCGCSVDGHAADPSEPKGFSTEPPFPPGAPHSLVDDPLELPGW
ncbi:hypothetical protein [Streptomyces noursei]|uniref:hypothetical protein n=1 Tax=Streptomyces noursei TaxID=1971 RepID=UPI0016736EA2|nr:hypothetical protein [Streptomyces noursei]MCZ1014423.1 hypothetical protein [Streptomyces noursei]GGW94917.1 hypothetical protein GCM10010341_15090 [Streptomyces noursei]